MFPDNSSRNKNNGGYELQFRESKGGASAAVYPSDYTSETPEFPVLFPDTWIRLKRSGNTFEAFCGGGEKVEAVCLTSTGAELYGYAGVGRYISY
ncbi:hypothetical protein ACT8ZS_10670 [Paenibacillus sp. M.A.Huq-84]